MTVMIPTLCHHGHHQKIRGEAIASMGNNGYMHIRYRHRGAKLREQSWYADWSISMRLMEMHSGTLRLRSWHDVQRGCGDVDEGCSVVVVG